jgi:hypothetical protein
MIGFDGRHQWRQHQLFKLRANLLQCKIHIYFNDLYALLEIFAGDNSHEKFAIRSFLEFRFAQFLCGAQELSRSVAWLRSSNPNLAGVDRVSSSNCEKKCQ